MQEQPDCIYAWLDTGYVDRSDNPVMISLLRSGGRYTGHYVGNYRSLSGNAKDHFGLDRVLVEKKMRGFAEKYAAKSDERNNRSILDEGRFLLENLHQFEEPSELALKLRGLGLTFGEEPEEQPEPEEIIQETDNNNTVTGFNDFEERTTIAVLLEQMEDMQKYMDELVERIKKAEKDNLEKDDTIRDLCKRNDEYKKQMMDIRMHMMGQQEKNPDESADGRMGHSLLGRKGKILVIGGQDLGENVMQGIGRTMGFEKKDFEFVDYDKTKDYMDRVRRDGRFSAVIIGACPHKTTASAGYTSTVEKMLQIEGMPYTVAARCKSGKLKVTKESFRDALADIYVKLSREMAG